LRKTHIGGPREKGPNLFDRWEFQHPRLPFLFRVVTASEGIGAGLGGAYLTLELLLANSISHLWKMLPFVTAIKKIT